MKLERNVVYEFGPFRLDPAERLLLRDDEVVSLKPKVFDTLLELIWSPGRLISKAELISAIWLDSVVEENNLTQNISALRKALGERADENRYIETVPGHGYRFVAPVSKVQHKGADISIKTSAKSAADVENEIVIAKGEAERSKPSQNALEPVRARAVGMERRLGLAVRGILILALALAGAFIVTSLRSQKVQNNLAVKSIAVLPFKSIGADEPNTYLGLGMADALITKLSNLKRIVVRPTSAVRKYTAREEDAITIGQRLGVESVLEGSIQKIDDRVRVTVQLVRVADGQPLWADKFDQRFADIFFVQDSISEQVARAFVLKVSGEERGQLTKHYTQNPEAYQLYLKGRYFWNQRTAAGVRKGIDYFSHAIKEDPNYAAAHAGLADCYVALGIYGAVPPPNTMTMAKAAATKALEIDETLAEATASLAEVEHLHDWNWTAAEKDFKQAINLNPNYAPAHQWYAIYLATRERFDEAFREMRRAQEIEPLLPMVNTNLGWLFYLSRQYEEAITQYKKTLELDPDFVLAHEGLGMAYRQSGMYEQALTEFQAAAALSARSPLSLASLGHMYAVKGNRHESQRIIEELMRLSKREYVSPYFFAAIHTALGAKEKAFEWFERAYLERSDWLVYLNVEPALDGLRQDPRFQDLLQRVGPER